MFFLNEVFAIVAKTAPTPKRQLDNKMYTNDDTNARET